MSAKVSVVMPVYNEAKTVREIVERVLAAPFDKEIIAVDDGSTDGSGDILRALVASHPDTVRVVSLGRNSGKGAALRSGFAQASGDVLIVQDADLEYDPTDIPKLLAALDRPGTDVVYGSRIRGRTPHGYASFYLGGVTVSLVASLVLRTHISDEPTCYKMFPRRLLEKIDLACSGFEFCPEFTAKALRRGCTLREVPIRYHARRFDEGKKIRWVDGVKAVWFLLRYALSR
jgi:glycosyltransferase involved in cell wall biosynthesis